MSTPRSRAAVLAILAFWFFVASYAAMWRHEILIVALTFAISVSLTALADRVQHDPA